MKKSFAPLLGKISLLAVAAALLFTLAGCKKDSSEYAPPTGFQLASDENADYCLYVPDKWTVDMTTAASGAYFSAADPSSVSVMAWDMGNTDSTLDDWWEVNKNDISLVFSDFSLVSEENTTIDGAYAKRYVYTAKLGEDEYKFLQQAALKNGSVYLFTYTAKAASYDSHIDEVEEIAGFIKLK